MFYVKWTSWDTDSEKLHISLSNQWFSLIAITASQRVGKKQIICAKTSPQKSVILPIIQGIPPTSHETHWNKKKKEKRIKKIRILSYVTSAKDTRETLFKYFQHWLVLNSFPEIRRFADNSGRFSNIMPNSLKLPK